MGFWRAAAAVASIAVVLVAVLEQWRASDAPRACRAGDAADPLTDPQCFYSSSYHAARALFLHHARAAENHGVKVHSFPLGAEHPGLYVDIAVRSGRADAVVMHVSGTHGTEGYLGSAVQSAFLRRLRASPPAAEKDRPTVVIVHALNAYGMAHYRRWNEENVDLNRNCFADAAQMEAAKQRDPNIAGYEDLDYLLNPHEAPTPLALAKVVAEALQLSITDFRATKRALVAGTYTNAKGVYYGGREPSFSHATLSRFMSAPYHADNSSLLRAANRLAIVDVHSGLGPEGRDTLMASTDEMAVELGKHFKGGVAGITELDSVSIQGMSGPQGGAQGGAAEGYDLTVGDMIPCYTGHHSKARQGLPEAEMSIGFCQEFGTRAPVFVALSLVFENMAHHFGTPEQREYWAGGVFSAFFVSKQSFMESVMGRGLAALEQAITAVSA